MYQYDDDESVPLVVNTRRVLQLVHTVTMDEDADQATLDMANSLLSGILPELRYPTTTLHEDLEPMFKALSDRYERSNPEPSD